MLLLAELPLNTMTLTLRQSLILSVTLRTTSLCMLTRCRMAVRILSCLAAFQHLEQVALSCTPLVEARTLHAERTCFIRTKDPSYHEERSTIQLPTMPWLPHRPRTRRDQAFHFLGTSRRCLYSRVLSLSTVNTILSSELSRLASPDPFPKGNDWRVLVLVHPWKRSGVGCVKLILGMSGASVNGRTWRLRRERQVPRCTSVVSLIYASRRAPSFLSVILLESIKDVSSSREIKSKTRTGKSPCFKISRVVRQLWRLEKPATCSALLKDMTFSNLMLSKRTHNPNLVVILHGSACPGNSGLMHGKTCGILCVLSSLPFTDIRTRGGTGKPIAKDTSSLLALRPLMIGVVASGMRSGKCSWSSTLTISSLRVPKP